MGYQALLFCPDEKLARVVSQVFSELDFAVDPVAEPFGALKKLMAQRYDAVVIDCENEQNSSLLLKSARTSTLNQGSLAIAVVEGQAGVAKAYRIGANLVLTKPINVEQAKGTLRVARGLLRKNLEAATAAGHPASPTPAATASSAPAARSIESANRIHEVAPAPPADHTPEFKAPLPAMASPASLEAKPVPAPVPALQSRTPVVAQVQAVQAVPAAPATPASPELVQKKTTTPEAPGTSAVPVLNTASQSQGAASAPAPAKEIAAPAKKPAKKEKQDELFEIEPAAQPPASSSSEAASRSDAPSFAALGDENADGSGSKKILIAAVAVVAIAAAGYFGWTKFGQVHSNLAPQASVARPQMQTAPAPDLAPISTPAPVAPASTTNHAPATVIAPAPKTSSTPLSQPAAGSSASPQNALLQPEADKTASASLVVKSATAKNQAQPDVSSAQLPNPLAIASPNDSGLGGLLSSDASNVARPSLARIRVSQGVSQGMVIKRVQPRYPANALAAHIQGAVQIEATVNKEGIVVNPKVLSGDSVLAAAALEAVRQWRYKPYYLDGEPVEIQTQITIKFKANQ